MKPQETKKTIDCEGSESLNMISKMVDGALLDSVAMALTFLTIMDKDHGLGNKIREHLQIRLGDVYNNDEIHRKACDIETEIMPTREWLSFCNGFLVGRAVGNGT